MIIEDLNEAETQLVDCFTMGNPCLFETPPGALVGMNDGAFSEDSNKIRSEVIQELLLSPPEVAPGKSVKLILLGANISGKLDFGCGSLIPFLFQKCVFDSTPNLNDSKADFVGFVDCLIPGIELSRATVNGPVWFQGTRFFGAVRLDGSSVLGDVDFRRCSVKNSDTHGGSLSVSMQGLKAQGNVYLSNKFECEGGINAEGVSVAGKLICENSKITSPRGMALLLDHSDIKFGFHGTGLSLKGSLSAHHAIVGCQFSLRDAKISEVPKKALRLDHVVVSGSIFMDRAIMEGEVDLHGVEVSCHVRMNKIKVVSPDGYAVIADQMKVGGFLNFRDAEISGGILLAASHIGSKVIFDGARLSQNSYAALNMDSCTVMNDVQAASGFRSEGTVVLRSAIINGFIKLSDAVFDSGNGRAFDGVFLKSSGGLIAERSKFTGLFDISGADIVSGIRLSDSDFVGVAKNSTSLGLVRDKITGERWRGYSIRALGAKIDGDLKMQSSNFSRTVSLEGALVRGGVLMEDSLISEEGDSSLEAADLNARELELKFRSAPKGSVSLQGAEVGTLIDGPNSWPENAMINIIGLSYRDIESDSSIEARLSWLKKANPSFNPQPYAQLSRWCLESGNEADHRAVEMESIRRFYKSGSLLFRFWGFVQDKAIGFGFKPARAISLFLLTWLLGSAWFAFAARGCSGNSRQVCPIKADEHPTWDPMLYSLDILIPLLDFGHGVSWDPMGASKVVFYILTISGWVLVTTIIAAFGRFLKR
jgi:hypothetical protein